MIALPPPRSPGRLFVALDGSPARARAWAAALAPLGVRFKVGMELFYQCAGGLPELGLAPGSFFLDLKLHDIPNTLAGGMKALAALKPFVTNVHCSAGPAGLAAAARAVSALENRPLLIGVTVLTSLTATEVAAIGHGEPPGALAVRLARLAKDAGLDGVVCSGEEIAAIKAGCGADFLTIVPGIRPAGAEKGDQSRVVAPAEALRRGADFLVVGRPITGAGDPAAACRAILAEMAGDCGGSSAATPPPTSGRVSGR